LLFVDTLHKNQSSWTPHKQKLRPDPWLCRPNLTRVALPLNPARGLPFPMPPSGLQPQTSIPGAATWNKLLFGWIFYILRQVILQLLHYVQSSLLRIQRTLASLAWQGIHLLHPWDTAALFALSMWILW